MPGSTLAGVITATAGVVTAVALLVTSLGALLPQLRGLRKEVKAVHTIVNQQRTDMIRYERALIAALKRAGVEVPVDQSVEPEEGVR